MELLVGIVIGAVAAAVAVFLMWRNNRKKFIERLINIDTLITRYDTVKEAEAKIDEVLAELRASLIAKAESKLNKLK